MERKTEGAGMETRLDDDAPRSHKLGETVGDVRGRAVESWKRLSGERQPLAGRGSQIFGRVQQLAGRATNDRELEARGGAREAGGWAKHMMKNYGKFFLAGALALLLIRRLRG